MRLKIAADVASSVALDQMPHSEAAHLVYSVSWRPVSMLRVYIHPNLFYNIVIGVQSINL